MGVLTANTPASAGVAVPDAHALDLTGLRKTYSAAIAVDDVSLHIPRGEFLTLLGPSGSGKTTLLMMIAGFTSPDAGAVRIDGRDITATPPEQRNFGMVFHGYALFPHMTVAGNVAYPLRVRRLSRAAIAERVREALALVRLTGFDDRRPAELSGGQQQRVAIARALVFRPDVLLLDEPLGALDRQLRAEVQVELKALHRTLGTTFVYVTHDQDEALSMSDRVAIVHRGRIEQVGPPATLYERPRTRFAAEFLGRSNCLSGRVVARDDGVIHVAATPDAIIRHAGETTRSRAMLALRPEKITLSRERPDLPNTVPGKITATAYLGATLSAIVDTQAFGLLTVSLPAWTAPDLTDGATVWVGWPADATVLLADDPALLPTP